MLGTRDDAKAHIVNLYQSGDFLGAEQACIQANAACSGWAEGWLLLGFAQQALAKHSDAIASFRTSIGIEPENAEGHFGLARSLQETRDLDGAITALDEAIRFRPQHVHARLALVTALQQRADIEIATGKPLSGEADLERAIKIDRHNPEPVVKLVQHFIDDQQEVRAKGVLVRSVSDLHDSMPIRDLVAKLGLQQPAHVAGRAAQSQQRAAVTMSQQIPCPSCKRMVMDWTYVCPHCNYQIRQSISQFAQQAALVKTTRWQDVAYIILAVLWMLRGGWTIFQGLAFSGEGEILESIRMFFTIMGLVNVGVGLGLLFQVEWVQFVCKIMCYLTLGLSSYALIVDLALSHTVPVLVDVLTMGLAGFQIYLLKDMSDI